MSGDDAGSNRPMDLPPRNGATVPVDDDLIPIALLRRAAADGLITAPQLDAILRTVALSKAEAPPVGVAVVEAPRSMNPIAFAYWAGAITVLFAFAWFLIERWKDLGPGGVLAVSLVYAAIFEIAGRMFVRRGFTMAAAMLQLLIVGMAPIFGWSVLKLAGWWWADYRVNSSLDALRFIPINLFTLLAVAVLWRRSRFSLLALPGAIAFWLTIVTVLEASTNPLGNAELDAHSALIAGTMLLAIGYLAERLPAEDEGPAFWLDLVGLIALAMGLLGLWNGRDGIVAHAMLGLAVICAAIAVRLGRRVYALFAAGGFVGYIGYLAFDLFDRVASFPVVLATFGIIIILLAVIAQQRFPDFVRRMSAARRDSHRTIPGARLGFSGSILIAVVLCAAYLPGQPARAKAQQQRREWQVRRDLNDRKWRRSRPRMVQGRPATIPPR